MTDDHRVDYPATQRNSGPILEVLRSVLPASGTVLELSSGTGQHAVHFARELPHLSWQTSDFDPKLLASIEAWRLAEGGDNLLAPLRIDVTQSPWPLLTADAVFNANMIHIAPWACTLALLDGVSRLLSPGAPFVQYGPFMRGGEHTAPSNARFDESLRGRDPSWGVRDLDIVIDEARARGLELEQVVQMPANNLSVIYRRI